MADPQAQFEAVVQEAAQRAVAAMQANFHRPASTMAPPKPARFDGQACPADEWTFEMELYFDACGIQDPQRLRFAGAMLTGPALIWWRTLLLDNANPNPVVTWDDFKAAISHQFKHVDSVKQARQLLRGLRQTATVSRYYTAFAQAALQIPGMTDDEKMDRFVTGLKPSIQREIMLRDPEDFKTIVKMAHKLDALATQRPFSEPAIASSQTPSVPAPVPEPMEIGSITVAPFSRPKLTDAERDELRRRGACFYCKPPGHMASLCPNKPK